MTSSFDFPTEAILWIKEKEMVDSVGDLKSSRSMQVKDFPNIDDLDARIASVLNKIIQNSYLKNKSIPEEQDRFLQGRQIAFMIHDHIRVTGAHDIVLDCADLFFSLFVMMMFKKFDSRWDDILLSMTKIRTNDFLESLYKLRRRELDQFKAVQEVHNMEFHQKMSMPSYRKLKTMVKRSIDHKLRLRNFDARHGRIETGRQWLRVERDSVVMK